MDLIDEELKNKILDIIDQLEKKRLYKGKGGEIMRVAGCRLIEAISIAKFSLKSTHIKKFQVCSYKIIIY